MPSPEAATVWLAVMVPGCRAGSDVFLAVKGVSSDTCQWMLSNGHIVNSSF